MTEDFVNGYKDALKVIFNKSAENKIIEEAFCKINQEANSGNEEAMFYVGHCYEYGKGTAVNYDQAIYCYTKSAKAGFVRAMERMGFIYAYGKIVEKNMDFAIYWYNEAAKHGNRNAIHRLGEYYYNGYGVEQNYKIAANYFKQLSEVDSYINQFKLAVCYYNGQGVEQDYAKAAYWFEKSANIGYDNAMICLGYCYEKGYGVKQNYNAAIDYYSAASEKGVVEATIRLGLFYVKGLGVKKDAQKAFDLFVRAHDYDHNDILSIICIGNCYNRGDGVEQNLSRASEWYNKSAGMSLEQIIIEKHEASCISDRRTFSELLEGAQVLNNSECQCYVGHCYYFGFGISQDFAKATEWYGKAAENGNAESQTFIWLSKYEVPDGLGMLLKASDRSVEAKSLLADCYSGGWGGVTEDKQKAVKLYGEAASNGDIKAMYNLARHYENGVGIRQSYLKAEEWYSRFVKEWNEESINLLRNRVMMYR